MSHRSAILLAASLICGCTEANVPIADPDPTMVVRTYPLVGEVVKIEAAEGKVTIRHEAIPGYMAAMTMPFRVSAKERGGLDDLQVGDKVAATLKVGPERSELEDLSVTEPATPKLTLDLSGPSPTLRAQTVRLEPGQAVPDFAVTTQEGTALRLSDLRGKVVALTFIYTSCPLPDFCPKMDAKFAELSRLVDAVPGRADKVRLLSISFDPEHDTPSVLAKHAKLKGAKPPLWQFAVASHDELRKVAESLGLMYGPRKDEIIHNLSTAIIGPDGKLIRLYSGSSWTPEEALKLVSKSIPR